MTKLTRLRALTGWTLLELGSLRLVLTCVCAIAALALAAEFFAALALTAADSFRTVLYAAPARVTAMMVVTVTVAASVQSELESGLLELTRARPISAADWYVGRWAAFVLFAATLALAFGLPLMLRQPVAAAGWTFALGCELVIVASAAFAVATTLRHIVGTVTAVLGFYLLARTMHAIMLMSRGGVAEAGAWLRPGVDALALALPDLSVFAATARLTGVALPGPAELLLETVAFALLLGAIGLVDTARREF